MKNRIFAFTIAIIALGCYSAKAQTVSGQQDFTSGFSGINVSDRFVVTVRSADYYGVEWTVESSLKNYFHVYLKGSELVATVDRKAMDKETKKQVSGRKSDPVLKATVYAPMLSSVVAADDARVDLNNIDIKTESFNLDITDNARVVGLAVNAGSATLTAAKKAVLEEAMIDAGNLSINSLNSAEMTVDQISKNLSLQVNATSVMRVSGECETVDVNAANSSKLNIEGRAITMNLNGGSREVHAEELKVNDVKVVGSNNCKMFIVPSETLSLDLKGGCTVSYGGKPEIEIVNIQNSSVNHLH